MRQSYSHATRALTSVGAKPAQVALVQLTLEGLAPRHTMMSQPASAPTAVTAVPWATEVLQAHRRENRQPHANQVHPVLAVALDSLESLPNTSLQHANQWHTWLKAIPQDLRGEGPAPEDIDVAAFLKELAVASTTLTAVPDIRRVSREFVAALRSWSVEVEEFAARIANLTLEADAWSPALLAEAAEPPDRNFVVLVGLTGAIADPRYGVNFAAGRLEVFDPVEPRAFRRWGAAAEGARKAVNAMRGQQINLPQVGERRLGPNLFLEGRYEAPWRSVAARKAIDDAETLVTRIMLAHPRVRVDIFPFALSLDRCSEELSVHELNEAPLKDLRIDSPSWPTLSAAQAAAARTRGPRNHAHRTSLSWVSLEVLGFEGGLAPANKRALDDLSKTLCLHQLRQLLTVSYRTMVSSCGANSDESRVLGPQAESHHRRAVTRARVAERIPGDAERHLFAAARHRLLGDLYSVLTERTRDAEQHRRAVILDLEMSPAKGDNMILMGQLTDAPRWVRTLRGPDTELRPILDACPVWVQHLVNEASDAVCDRISVSHRLKKQQPWLRQQLRNLYVVRNMHLHAGVQEFRGDQVIADFGTSAVDALYEILALWPSGGSSDASPMEIVAKVATVFDELIDPAGRLDIEACVDRMLTPQGPKLSP